VSGVQNAGKKAWGKAKSKLKMASLGSLGSGASKSSR